MTLCICNLLAFYDMCMCQKSVAGQPQLSSTCNRLFISRTPPTTLKLWKLPLCQLLSSQLSQPQLHHKMDSATAAAGTTALLSMTPVSQSAYCSGGANPNSAIPTMLDTRIHLFYFDEDKLEIKGTSARLFASGAKGCLLSPKWGCFEMSIDFIFNEVVDCNL